MSEMAQGPDWWQGTDGKWYPPMANAAAPPAPTAPPGPPQPPGAPPPGYPQAGYPQPGYPQPIIVQQPKSRATPILLGCLIAVVAVPILAVICIAAVTLLGKSASSKFSSVSSAIDTPTTISSTYSAADLRRELTTGPNALPVTQANCIIDGLQARGVPLDKYKKPSAADQKTISDVVTECVLKDSGVTTTTR